MSGDVRSGDDHESTFIRASLDTITCSTLARGSIRYGGLLRINWASMSWQNVNQCTRVFSVVESELKEKRVKVNI